MYLIKEIHWGAQESCAWRGGGQSFFLWNSVMEPMEESKHAVTARFYWPGMGVDLDKWVNGIIWLECILDWGYPYIMLLPGLHSPCLLLNFHSVQNANSAGSPLTRSRNISHSMNVVSLSFYWILANNNHAYFVITMIHILWFSCWPPFWASWDGPSGKTA